MARPDRDRLTGEIEAGETYVGSPEEGMRGRAIEKKSIVVVAAEKNGLAIERIRLKRVKDVSKGYTGLLAAGYKHRVGHQRRERTSSRSHVARS